MRLELSPEPNQPGTYRAELLTIDGQSVLNAQPQRSADTDGYRAYLEVPAGLLKAGDYQIKLSRVTDGSVPIKTDAFITWPELLFIETRFSRTIHVHLQLCSSATPLE